MTKTSNPKITAASGIIASHPEVSYKTVRDVSEQEKLQNAFQSEIHDKKYILSGKREGISEYIIPGKDKRDLYDDIQIGLLTDYKKEETDAIYAAQEALQQEQARMKKLPEDPAIKAATESDGIVEEFRSISESSISAVSSEKEEHILTSIISNSENVSSYLQKYLIATEKYAKETQLASFARQKEEKAVRTPPTIGLSAAVTSNTHERLKFNDVAKSIVQFTAFASTDADYIALSYIQEVYKSLQSQYNKTDKTNIDARNQIKAALDELQILIVGQKEVLEVDPITGIPVDPRAVVTPEIKGIIDNTTGIDGINLANFNDRNAQLKIVLADAGIDTNKLDQSSNAIRGNITQSKKRELRDSSVGICVDANKAAIEKVQEIDREFQELNHQAHGRGDRVETSSIRTQWSQKFLNSSIEATAASYRNATQDRDLVEVKKEAQVLGYVMEVPVEIVSDLQNAFNKYGGYFIEVKSQKHVKKDKSIETTYFSSPQGVHLKPSKYGLDTAQVIIHCPNISNDQAAEVQNIVKNLKEGFENRTKAAKKLEKDKTKLSGRIVKRLNLYENHKEIPVIDPSGKGTIFSRGYTVDFDDLVIESHGNKFPVSQVAFVKGVPYVNPAAFRGESISKSSIRDGAAWQRLDPEQHDSLNKYLFLKLRDKRSGFTKSRSGLNSDGTAIEQDLSDAQRAKINKQDGKIEAILQMHPNLHNGVTIEDAIADAEGSKDPLSEKIQDIVSVYQISHRKTLKPEDINIESTGSLDAERITVSKNSDTHRLIESLGRKSDPKVQFTDNGNGTVSCNKKAVVKLFQELDKGESRALNEGRVNKSLYSERILNNSLGLLAAAFIQDKSDSGKEEAVEKIYQNPVDQLFAALSDKKYHNNPKEIQKKVLSFISQSQLTYEQVKALLEFSNSINHDNAMNKGVSKDTLAKYDRESFKQVVGSLKKTFERQVEVKSEEDKDHYLPDYETMQKIEIAEDFYRESEINAQKAVIIEYANVLESTLSAAKVYTNLVLNAGVLYALDASIKDYDLTDYEYTEANPYGDPSIVDVFPDDFREPFRELVDNAKKLGYTKEQIESLVRQSIANVQEMEEKVEAAADLAAQKAMIATVFEELSVNQIIESATTFSKNIDNENINMVIGSGNDFNEKNITLSEPIRVAFADIADKKFSKEVSYYSAQNPTEVKYLKMKEDALKLLNQESDLSQSLEDEKSLLLYKEILKQEAELKKLKDERDTINEKLDSLADNATDERKRLEKLRQENNSKIQDHRARLYIYSTELENAHDIKESVESKDLKNLDILSTIQLLTGIIEEEDIENAPEKRDHAIDILKKYHMFEAAEALLKSTTGTALADASEEAINLIYSSLTESEKRDIDRYKNLSDRVLEAASIAEGIQSVNINDRTIVLASVARWAINFDPDLISNVHTLFSTDTKAVVKALDKKTIGEITPVDDTPEEYQKGYEGISKYTESLVRSNAGKDVKKVINSEATTSNLLIESQNNSNQPSVSFDKDYIEIAKLAPTIEDDKSKITELQTLLIGNESLKITKDIISGKKTSPGDKVESQHVKKSSEALAKAVDILNNSGGDPKFLYAAAALLLERSKKESNPDQKKSDEFYAAAFYLVADEKSKELKNIESYKKSCAEYESSIASRLQSHMGVNEAFRNLDNAYTGVAAAGTAEEQKAARETLVKRQRNYAEAVSKMKEADAKMSQCNNARDKEYDKSNSDSPTGFNKLQSFVSGYHDRPLPENEFNKKIHDISEAHRIRIAEIQVQINGQNAETVVINDGKDAATPAIDATCGVIADIGARPKDAAIDVDICNPKINGIYELGRSLQTPNKQISITGYTHVKGLEQGRSSN